MQLCVLLEALLLYFCNFGQNIVDKSTELSNIGFSKKCFTDYILQFCSTGVTRTLA